MFPHFSIKFEDKGKILDFLQSYDRDLYFLSRNHIIHVHCEREIPLCPKI